MTNDNKIDDDHLFSRSVAGGTRIKERLNSLLQRGENLDLDDCDAVQEWVNATFKELKLFPSEHLSFRLHCVHTGLALVSISRDKAEEVERPTL